jgi:chemotaxis protein MotB
MNRRKKQLPISHERWLISYADFITLLFAFFVVLFSSAQGDRKKQTQIAAAMKKSFSQYGIFEGHAKKPGFDSSLGDSGGKLMAPPLASAPPNSLEDQEQIVQHIRNAIETFGAKAKEPQWPPAKVPHIVPQPDEDLRRFISFRQHPEGVAVSLQAAGFFDSGSATLRADAMPLLNRIARSLPNAHPC